MTSIQYSFKVLFGSNDDACDDEDYDVKQIEIVKEFKENPVPNKAGLNDDERELSLCGLQNLGNTCFINSIIQCLSHTQCFSEYFISEKHLKDIVLSDENDKSKVMFLEEVGALFLNMAKSSSVIAPVHFLVSLRHYVLVHRTGNEDLFRLGQQHDAEEFLNFMITALSQNLSVAAVRYAKRDMNELGY